MKYQIGDKVRIKSLDWYNENKDAYGNIRFKITEEFPSIIFSNYMSNYCGKIITIKKVMDNSYYMVETGSNRPWIDEMIEERVEKIIIPFKIGDKVRRIGYSGDICEVVDVCESYFDIKEEDSGLFYTVWKNYATSYEVVEDNNRAISVSEDDIIPKYGEYSEDNTPPIEWNLPDGYEFRDENGNVIEAKKIVLEKKKPRYPQSFKECLKVMNDGITMACLDKCYGYKGTLITKFQQLLFYRDAYWRIAGEEMGLDGPWEPEYKSLLDNHFYIIYTFNGVVEKSGTSHRGAILVFPTEEMRDAFYENFKEIIESCKELL